jgi:hypothetical protein
MIGAAGFLGAPSGLSTIAGQASGRARIREEDDLEALELLGIL